MDNENPKVVSINRFHGDDGDYEKFATEFAPIICTKCHEPILPGSIVIAINIGVENKNLPMKDYLRFTGVAYHGGSAHSSGVFRGRDKVCFDVNDLPGMEGRDPDFEEELKSARACQQSKMSH